VLSRRSRLLQLILGSAVLAAGHFCAPLGHAEAIVSGADNNLTIEARDTSLQDVLTALGAKFDLRVRGLSSLNRQVEGRYEGSLRAVVTRLLNGYDYVLKTDSGHVEVIVLGVAKQSETRPEYSQAVPIPTKRRSD
jgi:hypothetical protein